MCSDYVHKSTRSLSRNRGSTDTWFCSQQLIPQTCQRIVTTLSLPCHSTVTIIARCMYWTLVHCGHARVLFTIRRTLLCVRVQIIHPAIIHEEIGFVIERSIVCMNVFLCSSNDFRPQNLESVGWGFIVTLYILSPGMTTCWKYKERFHYEQYVYIVVTCYYCRFLVCQPKPSIRWSLPRSLTSILRTLKRLGNKVSIAFISNILYW